MRRDGRSRCGALSVHDGAISATWELADPSPSGPLPEDPRPVRLDEVGIRPAVIAEMMGRCREPSIRDELERTAHPATRLALLEDSLHHDRHAWPESCDPGPCRPESSAAASVRLTLPLPASLYKSARPADAPWTVPRPR